jgi:hypothetical protein
MNASTIRKALRDLGLSARRTAAGDIRVAFAGAGNEASASYCDTWEDAYGTGMAMARHAQRRTLWTCTAEGLYTRVIVHLTAAEAYAEVFYPRGDELRRIIIRGL